MIFEIYCEKTYQIQYYLNVCQSVASGFFGKTHTILLPYKSDNYWYLPDYNLFADPKFKKEIEGISNEVEFNIYNSYLFEQIGNVFNEMVTEEEIAEDIVKIKNVEEKLISFIQTLFGDIPTISKIIIIPTKFGTNGTFATGTDFEEEKKSILYCTYRIGDLEHLAGTILAGIIQHSCNFDESIFVDIIERQKIIEFFANYTLLSNFFGAPKSSTMLQTLNKDQSTYTIDTATYLAKMGYPAHECFSFDENNIYFNQKALLGLQDREYRILRLLIEKKNTIVTFDEIAQTYWKDDWREKFSLFGIVKVIERLRKSILSNGVKFQVIHTVRKKGYCLYD